ncbi:MAG: DUF6544 family protein [Sphingomonadaceae bacterium]
MGILKTIGKTALGLGAGTLVVLTGMKVMDDRYVDQIWRSLEQTERVGGVFSEEMVSDLPDAARRYFLHAIRPGAPLATRVEFGYTGEIKPGEQMPWMSLDAHQILVKQRGFVWKARTWKGPLVVTGRDHYFDGEGRMKIALFGLVPVVNASGPDLSRSAMGRLLMEGALLPTAFLPGPNVRIEGIDESRFTAHMKLQGETTTVNFTVDPEGRLTEMYIARWGDMTPDRSFQFIPYGIHVDEEATFEDYTIPSKIRVGWWYGTERYEDVVRMTMNWAHYE